jgi:hypothetical protein
MYFAINLFRLSEYSVTVLFASDLILILLCTISYFCHGVFEIEGLMQKLEKRNINCHVHAELY